MKLNDMSIDRGFLQAIDRYISDQRVYGRINSPRTERAYRSRLLAHAADVGNRPPRAVGRDDVKTTLARWHGNTQRHAHTILCSFYDWCMEEEVRKDNPARQIRRARKRDTTVYRLTRGEVVALMRAVDTRRERFVVFLLLLTGARNQELRGFQGRHFARGEWVWFSGDIAKGGRERWVPVLPELEPVVAQITEHVGHDEFVVPSRRGRPGIAVEYSDRPSSEQAICAVVASVAERAGIAAHIHPHLLRHAFGDHMAKQAGLRVAQALLGHKQVGTTASTYVDSPTLDEIAVSVHAFSFGGPRTLVEYGGETPRPTGAQSPMSALTGVKKRSRPDQSSSDVRAVTHRLARGQRVANARPQSA